MITTKERAKLKSLAQNLKPVLNIGKDNLIELLPSCKEYCGFSSSPKDPRYKDIHMYKDEKITEHVRDTYRLYSYYKLFGNKINK